jgi:hypothetical protein
VATLTLRSSGNIIKPPPHRKRKKIRPPNPKSSSASSSSSSSLVLRATLPKNAHHGHCRDNMGLELCLSYGLSSTVLLISSFFPVVCFYCLGVWATGLSQGHTCTRMVWVDDLSNFTETTLGFALAIFNAAINIVSFSCILYRTYPPLFFVLGVYLVRGVTISVALGKVISLHHMLVCCKVLLKKPCLRTRELA